MTVGGAAGHPVVLGGPEVLDRLAGLLGPARQVAVVHQPTVTALAGRVAAAAGRTAHLLAVPDGEAAKRVEVAAGLWDRFAELGLDRRDAVVAVGGGAVTDLAGFAAAGWLRGVRVVHVPTTLLAMVDAAVGGKTGVDIAAGKNLVGAFHPPAGVLCDLDALASLPPAQLANGLAEVVKAGFVADPVILDLVEAGPQARLAELVERAVRVKAAVVAADPREAGPREVLNYGHTLGHAIERVSGYRVRHGEAVAVGMCFAAQLSRLAGRLDPVTCDRHAALLAGVGLPTRHPARDWPALRAAMTVDKKSRAGTLRFVVLDGPGRPSVLDGPGEDLLASAYREVSG